MASNLFSELSSNVNSDNSRFLIPVSKCSHWLKKDSCGPDCSDYNQCEASSLYEKRLSVCPDDSDALYDELDKRFSDNINQIEDDAEYSTLNYCYDDLTDKYEYVFLCRDWLLENLYTFHHGGGLDQLPSNILNDIAFDLRNAKTPSDLHNSISNVGCGILYNCLIDNNVKPNRHALCSLLDLKFSNYEKSDILLIGKRDIEEYLNPKHPYFADKQGSIISLKTYSSNDCIDGDTKTLIYPKTDTPKNNPYHQKQLNYSSISHFYTRLIDIIDGYKLKDPALMEFVFTFPKELTDALFNLGPSGEKMAWKTFKTFMPILESAVFSECNRLNKRRKTKKYAESGLLGHRSNLHLWKSEDPLNPHYHIHDSVLNYALVGSAESSKLESIPYYLSDTLLKEIKRLWTIQLLDLAKSLGVSCPTLTLDESQTGKTVLIDDKDRTVNYADVRYQFVHINDKNKGIVYHDLFYQNRSYLIDFAKYSNEHPDCVLPCNLLLNYDNRGRSFGLFRKLKQLSDNLPVSNNSDAGSDGFNDLDDAHGCDKMNKEIEKEKNPKICPFCGKPMVRGPDILFASQLPDTFWAWDYDKKEKRWVKTEMKKDDFLKYCSPSFIDKR